MAKRKKQNIEIERQVKQRKTIFRVVSIAVAAVIVLAVGAGIWTVQDSRWIMRYEGGRVAVSDFRAVLDIGFRNDPAAREAALGSVQAIVAMRDRAIYHGVDLTPEERAHSIAIASERRQERIELFNFDTIRYISNARLGELIFTEPLVDRLKEIYIPTYEIDEDEFAELMEEYVSEEIYRYMDLQVQTILTETREDIEEAYSLLGTVDFEDLVRQFTEGFEEDSEVEPVLAMEFVDMFEFDPDDRKHLLYLEAGEYSRIMRGVVEGLEFFFIFRMVSREEPDLVTLTAELREEFVELRRSEIFDELVADWIEAANFTINQRGYDRV